jgi:hypothetical protein
LLIELASVTTCAGVTALGMVGDGNPSIYYVASTGEFGIQPDGFVTGIFLI